MIQRIYIKNYILIREISIDFREGFTVITGATGAGKSMLISAIGLILGNRSDSKCVGTGARKAIVEAEFSIGHVPGLRDLMDTEGLDYDTVCILRREVMDNGKSRAFVNDTPVALSVLKTIGERLVDIHSQHHNMLIGDADYQMSVIDILADHEPLLQEYKRAYSAYKKAEAQYHSEARRIEEQKKEADFISFQYQQLDEAKIRQGELAYLEERQAIAQHGQAITEVLRTVASFYESAGDGHPSVSEQISIATKMLGRIITHYSQADELYRRMESLEVELSDIIREAGLMLDAVDIDPKESEEVEMRLDLLQGLLHKHHLSDSDELIALRDRYAQQLSEINDSDHFLRQLKDEVAEREAEALRVAALISDSRDAAAKLLMPRLHEMMNELGISGATFKVERTDLPALALSGKDRIQFLFATNKQAHLQPIREIASGGEISRFMLALKRIIAESSVLPTIIFDEIDTGVSGEIAEKLGRSMKELSAHLQVISITHLPQIAALSDQHLVVRKEEEQEGYYTNIEEVSGEERIKELATMLSGATLTSAALANAKELLAISKENND